MNLKQMGESMSTKLQSGTGTIYEIGYAIPIRKRFHTICCYISTASMLLAGMLQIHMNGNTKYLVLNQAYSTIKISSFLSLYS